MPHIPNIFLKQNTPPHQEVHLDVEPEVVDRRVGSMGEVTVGLHLLQGSVPEERIALDKAARMVIEGYHYDDNGPEAA